MKILQKIEDAVSGVLDALHEQRLKEPSIRQISWSVYRPIINWHYKHGTEFYSSELLESLCERQRIRCESGEVCRKFYRSFVTASFRIRSFGTELAEAEAPVTSFSQMLGHSDMSSGKAYLSFNRTKTALCSADFSEVSILKSIYADAQFPSCCTFEKGGDGG